MAAAVTDTTGLYSISLDPASYTATVAPPGFTPDTVSLAIPGGTTVVHDFVLTRLVPGSITGTVTDDDGVPLPNIRVSFGVSSARTDPNGRYTLTSLPPGRVEVSIAGGIIFLPQVATVIVVQNQTTEFDFALVRKNKL